MSFVFRRLAGSFHVSIDSFSDLVRLSEVPEAHWVATAAPTTGLHCDPAFLAAVDTDGNGRVRAAELKAAVTWTASMLADANDCVPGSDVLAIAHLSAAAAPLKAAAALVGDTLSAPDRSRVTLAQVREVIAALKQRSANGDGVVPPAAIADPALQALATDVLAHFPGADDASGAKGVDKASIAAFVAAKDAALAWIGARSTAFAWGDDSVAMAGTVRALQAKVDEYFVLCRLVASQPETAAALRIAPERAAGMMGDAASVRAALEQLPLAPPDGAGVLRWSAAYRTTRHEAVVALQAVATTVLGDAARDGLDEAGWAALVGSATTILAWSEASAAHPVAALGADRLALATAERCAALDALCDADLAVAEPLARVAELERLVLYQRWLYEFANNFVAMPNLYRRTRPALYEQGTLVMSGRNFGLSMLVHDHATHAALAGNSLMFLLYVQVARPERSFEVVVPVTSGTSRGLYVGKRGIFHAVDGNEYDATVTSMIINPVSIWEAILEPFQRLGAMITGRLEKWQAEADAEFSAQLAASVDQTQAAATAAATPPAPAAAPAAVPETKGMDPSAIAGVAAAGGLAFAAIGSTLAGIAGFLGGDGLLETGMRVLGLLSIIAAPFALVAWWKLRRRNVSGLLSAAGWALNDELRLSRALGVLFTRRPARPAGSRLDWNDETLTFDRSNLVPDEEETMGATLQRFVVRLLVGVAIAALLLHVSGMMGPFLGLFGIALSAG